MSLPTTMKAAVHTGAYQLDIRNVPVPEVSDPDHVLLKVGAVGICGSDKHDLDHPPQMEQVPGHEFAGTVAALGPEAAGYSAGDRVLVRPRARCGTCEDCVATPRRECVRGGVYGCRGNNQPPGAMAEYVRIRTENLTSIPAGITFQQAALTDPLAVAIHAIHLGPDVQGQTCVVMGAGVIGLLLGQVLKLYGAGKVVMVDVLQSHLDTAESIGGFICLNAADREGLVEKLEELDVSVFYELAGGESPTLDIAVETARKGASILLVSQRPKGVWLNYQWVMGKQLCLQGVAGTSDKSWAEAEKLIFERKVDLEPVITHRYTLDQANEALAMACHGDSLKVLIIPSPEEME